MFTISVDNVVSFLIKTANCTHTQTDFSVWIEERTCYMRENAGNMSLLMSPLYLIVLEHASTGLHAQLAAFLFCKCWIRWHDKMVSWFATLVIDDGYGSDSGLKCRGYNIFEFTL